MISSRSWVLPGITVLLLTLVFLPCARGEDCQTSTDMDDGTRSALTSVGQRYFNMIGKGDTASLKANSIPSLASDFSGIEGTIKENQPKLAGTQGTARPPFLLDAPGTAPIAHAEFFCGVFGKTGQTSNSAAFYINNLSPGKYGVVLLDAAAAKPPETVSFILQQVGSEWKLGGLYVKSLQLPDTIAIGSSVTRGNIRARARCIMPGSISWRRVN